MALHPIERRAKQLAAAAVVATYPDETLLTPNELADWLGVHKVTVARWCAEGEGPPAVRAGLRALRFKKADVKRWLDQRAEA